ncbi:10968_t:CDS:2, partial [Dentiscutata heterogama]
MAKHLLVICEEIHQDERDNIENILKNTNTKKTKNLQKNNQVDNDNDLLSQVDNDLLLQVDNYNDNCNDLSKAKNTSVLFIGEKASINRQLLKALISANALLSFVEDPEVIKLFHILKSEYKLPSRKWLNTDILDKIHENIQCSIQHFISDSMFLTLSDNYSDQHHTGNNIFAIYKEIGISLGLNKWIAFISDSGPNFKKAQCLMCELLKPCDYVIKILETEKATLGQVAASWAWLRGIVDKSSFTNNNFKNSLIIEIDNRWQKIYNPVFLITWFLHPYHHGKGLNSTWLLYIQEAAYGLFCTFYPDRNQDQFIDEWLNYANQEGPFSASSIKNPSFTKFPLRYWRTMLSATPNLSEFACRLLSIPPNSATSEQ